MFKDKKVVILLGVITFELLFIISITIVNFFLTRDNYSTNGCEDPDDDTCSEWSAEGEWDNEDESESGTNPLAFDFKNYSIDPETYGDSFLSTYTSILKSKPISENQFSNFVILSEYYSNNYYANTISGENLPTKYYASIYKVERTGYAYPYNVLRRIAIEIPSEGCAVFDFSPDFQYLNNYSLDEETCNGTV